MTSRQRSLRLVLVAALAPALFTFGPARRAEGQPRGAALVMLTLSTGTVLLAEVRYESDKSIKVLNLQTGLEEEFQKHPKFFKADANSSVETRLPAVDGLRRGTDTAAAKPTAVRTQSLTTVDPDKLKRLGKFPDNVAAYVTWLHKSAEANKTIAVLALTDTRGAQTQETVTRTEDITGALSRRGLELVERTKLRSVVGELVRQQGMLFDNALAQKIGQQVGAGAVLVGTLSPKRDKADLNLRLVDVATGRILDAPKLTDIEGLPNQRRALDPGPGPGPGVSIVGEWDVTGPNGRVATWAFRNGGRVVIEENRTGRWEQTGLSFVVVLSPPAVPKKKAGGGGMTLDGRLGPGGRRFNAQRQGGGPEFSGVRK